MHVDIPEQVPKSATRLVIVDLAWAEYLGTVPVWLRLEKQSWDVINDFDRSAVRRVINSRSAQPCESDTSFIEHAVL